MIKNIFLLLLSVVVISSCDKEDNNQPNQSNPENEKPTGVSAHDILSADTYDKLILEVQYVAGMEPSDEAINNLKTLMESRLLKPEGISIQKSEIPSPGEAAYSIDEVIKTEEDNRTQYTRNNIISLYAFFADADYEGNTSESRVLGVAYRNTSFVIFEKTIRDLSGGVTAPPRDKLETAVMNHELGHLLGLVNNGTAMQNEHQDEPHGRHCDNEECLMYYAMETGDVVDNLLGNPVPELDQNCLDDLKANGGK